MEPECSLPIHKCPPPVPILSQLDPVHTPHSTSWRSILILSSQLHLALPSGLFLSGFPTKTIYTPLLSLYFRYKWRCFNIFCNISVSDSLSSVVCPAYICPPTLQYTAVCRKPVFQLLYICIAMCIAECCDIGRWNYFCWHKNITGWKFYCNQNLTTKCDCLLI